MCARGEISSRHRLEPENHAAGTNKGEASEKPVVQIEGGARHRGGVPVGRVIVETLGTGVEVRKFQLAGCGAEERVLFMHGFERGDVDIRKTDGRDHGWKATTGADVEHSRRMRRSEVRDDMETVDDLCGDLAVCPCRG